MIVTSHSLIIIRKVWQGIEAKKLLSNVYRLWWSNTTASCNTGCRSTNLYYKHINKCMQQHMSERIHVLWTSSCNFSSIVLFTPEEWGVCGVNTGLELSALLNSMMRHDQGVPKMTCAVGCNDARTIRQCLPYWREGVYLTFLSLLFAKHRRHLKSWVN